MESRGEIVLFTDADLSAPIEEADKLLAKMDEYDSGYWIAAVNRALIEVHESPCSRVCRIDIQPDRPRNPVLPVCGHAVRL